MIHPLLAATNLTHQHLYPDGCPVVTKPIGTSILAAVARPIAEVLAAIYSVIPNYAVAILGLSLLWMIIISPLTLKSTRSMLAMQRIQPEIKKLQAEHKNDRQALSQAQMDLFKEHNVSPFGSCLPMLLPLPVFFALFRVIDGLSHVDTLKNVTTIINNGPQVHLAALSCAEPNYLSPHTAMFNAIRLAGGKIDALGINLAKNALSGHSSFGAAVPYFILLLLMIGTQYAQTARMMSRNQAAADNPQAKIMKYMPILFAVIFIRFPAGVILYYTMSNICRVAQQEAMYLFDPKVKSLAQKDMKEVEDEVGEIRSRKRPRPVDEDAPAPKKKGGFREMLADARTQAEQQRSARASTAPKGAPTPKQGATPPRGGKPGQGKDRPAAKSGSGGPARPKAQPGSNGSGRPKTQPGSNGSGASGRNGSNGSNGSNQLGSGASGSNGGKSNGGSSNGGSSNGDGSNGGGSNGSGAGRTAASSGSNVPRTGGSRPAPRGRKRRGR